MKNSSKSTNRIKSSKNSSKSSTNNRRSNQTFGQKLQGWVGFFQRTATPQKAAAKTVETTSSSSKSGSKSNTNSKKNSTQQEKATSSSSTNVKNSTKSYKSSTNILEGRKRQGCVFHTTRRPECGWAKPRKLRASSRGNSVGYRQILAQLVEVKGLQSIL